MQTRHLSIVGTTASGKSAAALDLARSFPGCFEIVSVDSMQVYRGMDIGTAKPTAAEQSEVRHHVINIADPGDNFSLSQFQAAAWEAIRDIEGRGKRAILVGGTGLYLQSVLDQLKIPGQYPEIQEELVTADTAVLWERYQELDPLGSTRMEPTNRRRVLRALEVTIGSGQPFSSFGPGLNAFPTNEFRQLGLWLPRAISRNRIADRVDAMVAAGWLKEVAQLRNGDWSRTARQALGYPEWERHLDGSISYEAARMEVVNRTRTFARRQRMWFRRDPRIIWFGTAADANQLISAVRRDCEHWLARSTDSLRDENAF